MEFREISDDQWKFIKPYLPPQPIIGGMRADDRKLINGILFVLITGCRWGDIPAIYGSRAIFALILCIIIFLVIIYVCLLIYNFVHTMQEVELVVQAATNNTPYYREPRWI
jgi:hypothetical protein